MFVGIVGVMAALSAPADGPKKVVPMKIELFAAEDWYKSQAGEEKTFDGVLRYKPRPAGVVGFNRFHAFRLELKAGGQAVREVYAAGKEELLKPYADRRVRLTGKAVDMEVEGKFHAEIWPARLELLPDAPPGQPVKLLGKAAWLASTEPGTPGRWAAIRSREEFAAAIKPETEVNAALARVAKMLKVDGIDWSKHMLVVVAAGAKPTGGYKVDIVQVTRADGVLTVHWKLHAPKPGDIVTMAFTHPAQVVLIEQVPDQVVFVPPPAEAK